MAELRYNPLLGTWTMVASSRQNRPHMPKDYCPFCPSSGRVSDYEVLKFDNDFPVLKQNPSPPDDVGSKFYLAIPAYGKCEVILYSPDHNAKFYDLSIGHIEKLIDLWVERFVEMKNDPNIQTVFIFENKGEEVGVTMPHPHGQIYGYSYIPQKLQIELDRCKEHFLEYGECMICRMNREESEFKRRVIHENEHFIAYLPFFTDYPYGLFVVSKHHIGSIERFDSEQKAELAEMLKTVTGMFDKVFDRPFPYMMNMHQNPVNSKEYADSDQYFHFHIEFYPPLRAKDRIKYYASSEMGMWAAANVAAVEDSAMELRFAKLRYLSSLNKDLLFSTLCDEFGLYYGESESDIGLYSAPGRVNLIGDHIDYNGGFVLPVALECCNYLAIRKRSDRQILLRSLNFKESYRFSLDDDLVYNENNTWANYPLGVLKICLERGFNPESGFDALFFSEVPVGASLSSSAAIEVVFGYGILDYFGVPIDKIELAKLGREAENSFVGVQCGIMDQFASSMGKANHAILLDCEKLDYQYIPLELGEYKVVIVNTNKKRELVESKYNERRTECEAGLTELRQHHELSNLCSMSTDEFLRLQHHIQNSTVCKRVRHVVSENERVLSSAKALKEGDIRRLGVLMNESHISLRDDYEVTGHELDTLFTLMSGFEHCLGVRMTGAGFAGCVVSLVHKDHILELQEIVTKGYTQAVGYPPSFYISSAGDGVKRCFIQGVF